MTAFRLTPISYGDAIAQVLGYPISEYNPACRLDPDFISPLTLRWLDGTDAEIFDSDKHGYHGELNSSAKTRGSGPPHTFGCEACGNLWFEVAVQFEYWDVCRDLLEDDPNAAAQDYFCNIVVTGKCTKCSEQNRILNMDL